MCASECASRVLSSQHSFLQHGVFIHGPFGNVGLWLVGVTLGQDLQRLIPAHGSHAVQERAQDAMPSLETVRTAQWSHMQAKKGIDMVRDSLSAASRTNRLLTAYLVAGDREDRSRAGQVVDLGCLPTLGQCPWFLRKEVGCGLFIIYVLTHHFLSSYSQSCILFTLLIVRSVLHPIDVPSSRSTQDSPGRTSTPKNALS